MIKIAHVKIPYLPTSETFIYEQLKGISNYQNIVITAKAMKNLDRFPFPHIYHWADFTGLAEFLKEQKVGLLHAHFGVGGTKILAVKRELGVPLLTSFHGVDAFAHPDKNPQYRELLDQLFEEGEQFTAVSKFMAKRLEELGCARDKIKVLHCGVNLAKFPYLCRKFPAKEENLLVLSIGRFKEKKGMVYLIEAFARLKSLFPQAQLVIIGEGRERHKLMEAINYLGLNRSVNLTGELRHWEVAHYISRAHLFCLASVTASDGDREGIPVVLMEAMAAGVPVISTYHSGIPELIEDGLNGFLAPERDAEALAQKMILLASNPQLWPSLTSWARSKIASEFNITRQISELEEIYGQLLTGGKV